MQRLYSKPATNLPVNISLMGMNGSGKSAILVKYLTRRFIVEYAPYLSDSYTKTDNVDGLEVTLNIQDTSDSDDIDLDEILKWSQAVIILFSITSRRSFYRAKELIESIKQSSETRSVGRQSSSMLTTTSALNPPTSPGAAVTSPVSPLAAGHSGTFRRAAVFGAQAIRNNPTVVLVANKSDLDRFRLVEKSEAEDFAQVKGVPYFETTAAATYDKVQGIFHAAVRLSNSSRFGKTRGTDGLGVPALKCLSSSTGALGTAAAATSVLSSLAVPPGLLLQKKSSTATTDSGASAPSAEPEQSTVSRLTSLRFRGASPPVPSKTMRSPSPSVPSMNRTEVIQTSPTTTGQPTQSATGLVKSTATEQSKVKVTQPGSTSSAAATTQPVGQTSVTEGTKSATTTTAQVKSDQTTTTTATTRPNAFPAPMPPKKPSIAFRLFGKKNK